ncbi:MAG TPA: SsrA-binding protein SmpB [Chloroflexia bacterium]|nr:SsrA-binding protein SmpB [Chloroflexia bacterium]
MSETRATRKNTGAPVIDNRRARHDYFIEETIEAGIALVGSEIKSVRGGRVNLTEGYVRIERGEAWLLNTHISPWPQAGTHFNHEPIRPRKLLLHAEEISRLKAKVEQKGLTLVPLKLYFVRGRAKLEIGVARGKKLYDKRDSLAERDSQREIARAVRDMNKYE